MLGFLSCSGCSLLVVTLASAPIAATAPIAHSDKWQQIAQVGSSKSSSPVGTIRDPRIERPPTSGGPVPKPTPSPSPSPSPTKGGVVR